MKPYKHQQRLLDLAPLKYGLFWGTGTGKSLASLWLVEKVKRGGVCLVVCPKSIKERWERDVALMPRQYEVITKDQFVIKASRLPKYEGLIIDEAHYFSGMRSCKKKSIMLKSMLAYIKRHNPRYIYLLTATPYLSTPWNIFALGNLLGYFNKKTSYSTFQDHFFQKIDMGGRWPIPVVRKNIENDIAHFISKMGEAIAMEECIDIPPMTFLAEYFNITKEQRKGIKALQHLLPMTRYGQEHQICGGTLKGDEYEEPSYFKNEKINRLTDLVQENKKVIIVSRYNYEIKYIKDQIHKKNKNKSVYIISGEVKDRDGVISQAERSSNCVVIVNAACSEGYELPSFRMTIFYSYDFSLKNYIQVMGRNKRINNLKKNVYISLIMRDSIDECVYQSILNKSDFDLAIYAKSRNRAKYERS